MMIETGNGEFLLRANRDPQSGCDPSKELIDKIAAILEGHSFALRADEHHRKVAREIFQTIFNG